ncbi:response regulator transcription factor [Flavobacterium aquidurense]|uniref:response regulator transcription factor n=1 Tax=Flavobacterium aquidurense TaxID=362413 RepID=UPI002856D2BB|nr:response regulator transcription factor [Flavobacterium aquidurense]MDR7371092.1 DNA-binding response OmpR family regulator [Flavobacterium aquidurense]
MKEIINVLLVEDEEVLSTIIKETLELRGFSFSIAKNGVEGWEQFQRKKPDICIVDIMMPRKDGYSLVEDIRIVDHLTPIIFLTAKNEIADVLKGLKIGADDYMKKPFSLEELILRIQKLVRRKYVHSDQATSKTCDKNIIVGNFQFNRHRLELTFEQKSVNLSQRESELLDLLIQNKNQLLDRNKALLLLWGDNNQFTARSMDVYITRLRKYLSADPAVEILSIRNKGFKLID